MDRTDPEHMFDFEVSFLVSKKKLGEIIDRCIDIHGTEVTAEVLDRVKAQGYKYSTKGAITVAVCDAVIPPQKAELLAEAPTSKMNKITRQFNRALSPTTSATTSVIDIWKKTTEEVSSALEPSTGRPQPHLYDGGFRRPRLDEPDPPAGRHARPDRQHRRPHHRDAH